MLRAAGQATRNPLRTNFGNINPNTWSTSLRGFAAEATAEKGRSRGLPVDGRHLGDFIGDSSVETSEVTEKADQLASERNFKKLCAILSTI
jgi:hypothetical protein